MVIQDTHDRLSMRSAFSLRLRRMITFLSSAAYHIPAPLWVCYDLMVGVCGLYLAYRWSPQVGGSVADISEYVYLGGAVIVGGLAAGLYERRFLKGFHDVTYVQFQATLVSSAIFLLLVTVFLFGSVGRWIIVLTTLFSFTLGLFPRLLMHSIMKHNPLRVVLLMPSRGKSTIVDKMKDGDWYFNLVGQFSIEDYRGGDSLGGMQDLGARCREANADILVVGTGTPELPGVLQACYEVLENGCVLHDECSFCEEYLEQVPVDHIDETWFFSSQVRISRRFEIVMKRALDILFSLFGMVLLIVLFPFVCFFIRVTSKGPALYSQVRCGQFGKPFTIYKFRTMVMDAEAMGVQWAESSDSRVTSIGKVLRKTRLDELPQFYNILKGDISFVGPRPERPELHEKIEREVPFFHFRLLVRPGLTGLAQIRYRYAANIESSRQKLEYDLYYIKNWSLLLDASIIFRTVLTLMKGSC